LKFPDIFFYRFKTNQKSLKYFKNSFKNQTQKQRNHVYLGFGKIPCGLFPKPLNKGIFSVFGRFIEDYLRNLTCWKKSKNRFGLNTPKLNKNF
jgi:hypothetical protein